MDVLFIHQNFPGQFRHIARHLANLSNFRVLAIGQDHAPGLDSVQLHKYRPHRKASSKTHPYARTFEEAVLNGQQVLRLLLKLQQDGYEPDVVVAHPGWGETLYVKQVFPKTRLIHFCEYYYHTQGADVGFAPEFPLTMDDCARISSRNALHLLNLENCDTAITPTHWQHSFHPVAYQDKIKVIHEGIDVTRLGPDSKAVLQLPNGKVLKAGEPTITYVARNLEPYRGFHQFMRALPRVLAAHTTCQVVIIGGDNVSYGSPPKDAANWRSKLLCENPVDQSRVHFLGKVEYSTYCKALQVSAVHIYLTYPFVLSWSLLEALASGCLVIASDTEPVREVIRHGDNGWLIDFFDDQMLFNKILDILSDSKQSVGLRKKAQDGMRNYSINEGVKNYIKEIK